jgi:hypothetical protein
MQNMEQPTDYGANDHEASMARGELYNAIKNAIEVFKMIEPGENLEGWVAAKITKAADYLNSVHDYLVYEKKYGTEEPVGEEYMEALERNLAYTLIEAKKPSAGLSKKQKSNVAKKARAGKDIGKKGKGFKDVAAKAAKKYGSKEKGEKVAAAAMWKNIKR